MGKTGTNFRERKKVIAPHRPQIPDPPRSFLRTTVLLGDAIFNAPFKFNSTVFRVIFKVFHPGTESFAEGLPKESDSEFLQKFVLL